MATYSGTKRSRMDGGAAAAAGSTYSPAVRRAMAISARIKSTYPYADYGRAYYRRGTPENLGRFGPSYRAANAEQRALRKQLGYVGRGGYFGRMAGRWIGSKFGHGAAGAAIGDRLGDIATNALALRNPAIARGISMASRAAERIFSGSGGYVSNELVHAGATAGSSAIPEFAQQTDGGIIVSNKEYVCDIYAPLVASAFSNQVFNINPGIEKTFPWLCQLAENYDEYELLQCIFTYKSTVADFAASTGQVGQIIMATQYNVAQQPFADKQTMMQYAYACSGKTSEDMLQGVECDPAKMSGPVGRFVRNGPVPVGYFGDLNNYDQGTLNIAVADCPSNYAGQQMGELWVSYTVRLRKPKFVTAMGWGISRDYYIQRAPNTIMDLFGTGSITQGGLVPVPSTSSRTYLQAQQNSIGSICVPTTAGAYTLQTTFPAGWTIANFQAPIQPNGNSMLISLLDRIPGYIELPSTYSGNLAVSVQVTALTTGWTFPALYPFWLAGQTISNILDMVDTNDLYKASVSIGLTQGAPTGYDAYQYTFHIRVSPPLNGVPNRIYFAVPVARTGDLCRNVVIDLAEYNTLFNAKQDGSNDAIVLQTPGGTITP